MRQAAAEGGYYFNPAFVADDPSAVADLSRFESGAQNAPGKYRMDLVVNGTLIDTRDVTFVENKADGAPAGAIYPCVSRELLGEIAVNLSAFPDIPADNPCLNIADVIPDAAANPDFEKLILELSIPQVAMNASLRGYIPPSRWDDGIPAAMLNYQYSGSNSTGSRTLSGTEHFLSLQSGINAGPWRLRDHSTLRVDRNGQRTWSNLSTTLERGIIPWRATMAAGDTWTGSDIFDTVRLRGIKLASDDMMLPESMRGFAPTVRGIARTAARVTVSQNGYEIYQAQVQPGAFEFADLYTTSNAGDLTVTVNEADGSTETFVVPYSALPVLRREGQTRYEVAAGRADGGLSGSSPRVAQGTLVHGLPAGVTAYGGLQLSPDYRAVVLGAGKNMGRFGAVSADITQAYTRLTDGSSRTGQSLRFLYARSLNELGTTFQLMGYRYSTEGFYTFTESTWHENGQSPRLAKKGRAQVSLSQQLPRLGSAYISGSQQNYWNSDQTDRYLQAGISGQTGRVSWNAALSESRSRDSRSDRAFTLSLSVPLGTPSWDDAGSILSRSYASWGLTHDMKGKTQNRAGISGSLNQDSSLSYSLQESHDSGGNGLSGSGQLGWNSPYANMTAGFAHSSGSRQLSAGLSGSIIAHQGGITAGQPLGESSVLIDAGAPGIAVENMPGVATDSRGYALVPWASAYRENRVALNVNTAAADTDVGEAVQTVVPTRGAVVKASFTTRTGLRMLVTLTRAGKPVPFGSMVTLKGGDERRPVTGIVGDDGQVYLAGMPPQGELEVAWGAGEGERCSARVSAPDGAKGMTPLSATCG